MKMIKSPTPEYIPLHLSQKHPKKSRSTVPGILHGKLTVALVMLAVTSGGGAVTALAYPVPAPNASMVTSANSAGDEKPVTVPASSPTTDATEPAGEPVASPVDVVPAVTVDPATQPVFAGNSVSAYMGTVSIERLWGSEKRTIYQGANGNINDLIDVQDPVHGGSKAIGQYEHVSDVGGKGRPFAITGHSGLGKQSPFTYVDDLQVGDIATIENTAGTYTYKFASRKNVDPSDNSPLEIPTHKASDTVTPNAQRMVITTCGVDGFTGWGDQSVRRIAYFDFVGFEPKA